MTTCTACNGTGKGYMIRDFADGHADAGLFDCLDCHGTGEVSDQTAAMRWFGELCRGARVEQRRPLGETARALGINAAQLSGFEHGRESLDAATTSRLFELLGVTEPTR